MFMLDTNTLRYFFKGIREVEENLFTHSPKDIFILSIVSHELQLGIAKSHNPQRREKQLGTLLEQVNIIEFMRVKGLVLRLNPYLRGSQSFPFFLISVNL